MTNTEKGNIFKQLHLDLDIPKISLGIEGLSKSEIAKELKNISELFIKYNVSQRKGKPYTPKYSGIGLIHSEIFSAFDRLVKVIPNEIVKCQGIPLVFYAYYFDRIPEIILRKCLLFGETTIIVLPSIEKRIIPDSLYYNYYIPSILVDFFLKYDSLIRDGLLIPIPRSVFYNIEYLFSSVENTSFSIFNNENILQYFGKDNEISELFMLSENHIFFPSLSNIRLKTIRDLREKEYPAFRNFHRNLQKIRSEKSTPNEKVLIELIKETDYEVRLIDSKVKNQKKLTYSELCLNLTGTASATLLANSNNETLKMAAAALGGASTIECFKLYTNHRKVMKDFKLEGFYFPWKLVK